MKPRVLLVEDEPSLVLTLTDRLRAEGKTWSLATGSYGDRFYLSIRTTNGRADAGRLMRRLIGRRGKGGGHGTMAGGFILLPKGANEASKTLERKISRRFAKYLKKNPERLSPIQLADATPAVEPALPGILESEFGRHLTSSR